MDEFISSNEAALEIFYDIFQDANGAGKKNSHNESVISAKHLLASILSKSPNADMWLAQHRVAQIFQIGDIDNNGYLTENDFLYVGSVLYPRATKEDLFSFREAFGKFTGEDNIEFNMVGCLNPVDKRWNLCIITNLAVIMFSVFSANLRRCGARPQLWNDWDVQEG